MTSDAARKIWEEVAANLKKLRGCQRHYFSVKTVKPGDKVTCDNCGGVMALPFVGEYIRGYEAGGGDPADIWPSYNEPDPDMP